MQIYLPIAELSVDVLLLLGLGGTVGLLSGLFGIGGGFLMTPLLIFIGIPPAIAVGTGTNQIVGSSLSGAIAHWRRRNVDFKMGAVLLAGGLLGSGAGILLFAFLRRAGQIDLVITLSYVFLLGVIGSLMLLESVRSTFRRRRGEAQRGKLHVHTWIHGLPFKMKFRRSKLYVSALLPISVGMTAGMLTALLGVGGGFVMLPAMIYLIGMPTVIVVGTSLVQIVFVTANVTLLQAVENQTVDLVLTLLLLTGGVVGAQIGTQLGSRLRGEELRGMLALLVLSVCAKLVFDLVSRPDDLFSLATVSGAA